MSKKSTPGLAHGQPESCVRGEIATVPAFATATADERRADV
jgi:hypothetical protein